MPNQKDQTLFSAEVPEIILKIFVEKASRFSRQISSTHKNLGCWKFLVEAPG